jgi:hypothetical protein
VCVRIAGEMIGREQRSFLGDNLESYFSNCSREYLNAISPTLHGEVQEVISKLPKRQTQAEINKDLFWLLTSKSWSFDTLPAVIDENPPPDLAIQGVSLNDIKITNTRDLCITSTTIDARWHSDFAKVFDGKLVQVEAQFGKVESMFKDFFGFKIAWHERRLALGIEIVMYDPGKYFAHRRGATSGMAYFDIAKKTLPAIGLDCPIWLVGVKE